MVDQKIRTLCPNIALPLYSELRQIPDNQEVLLWPDSNVTCIVEVLESVTEAQAGASDPQAAVRYVIREPVQMALGIRCLIVSSSHRFHFSSLAHDNEAESAVVEALDASNAGPVASIDQTPKPLLLRGKQQVRKFNKPELPLDTVVIHLALWRLSPAKNVDLVMSWNEPLEESDGNSSGSPTVAEAFRKAAHSLDIKDWGLFP